MRFDVLGPMRVTDGRGTQPVAGVRQRILLGALLVYANQPVSAGQLAEFVWDSAPPGRAVTTLRTYVARLRQDLGPDAASRILTRDGGYLAEVGPGELDALVFEALCGDAGSAIRAADWAGASERAAGALALWRGTPLGDVPSRALRDAWLPHLDQQRVQAAEWRIEAELRLGRHEPLVAQLRQLTANYPLRERFHAQLMQALAESGRQAEALAAYQDARAVLVEELGIEPGRELRRLHGRILAGNDGDGDPVAPRPPAAGHAPPLVPRQLPATVRHFTGRARELAALTESLDQAGQETPEMIVISAIRGTPGAGKTALAVYWAHQVTERFPDGQLYVNLRGHDPGQPMPATEALAGFLRSLGVADQDIPAGLEERASRYRSLLAGRQILIVLDNAGSVGQVRPLLPGSPACAVVVTSRDSLAGLVARDGAERLDLDLLPLAEAIDLLRGLIGERADDDPNAAKMLAEQCCRLPLALRLAAELAVSRPAAPLGELTEELTDQHKRLDLLDIDGDPHTAVRAVFSWSCRRLDPDAVHAFRSLGLHPGADFEPYAAAALTGTTLERAQRLLGRLARVHLIQLSGPGRYGLHDLLRVYARELAVVQDGPQERHEALTRLFDYYLHTATAAVNTVFPGESGSKASVILPSTPCPAVTSIAAARAWLDNERATLASVAAYTAIYGWPGTTIRLAATLFRYLEAGGYYPELIAIQDSARRAARKTNDRTEFASGAVARWPMA